MAEYLLVADLGGTKCDMALFDCRDGRYRYDRRIRYRCSDFTHFSEILQTYLEQTGSRPQSFVAGIAGVVGKDQAKVTNLPWLIDSKDLLRQGSFSQVLLVNDLTALCASIPLLGPDDTCQIQKGQADPEKTIAVTAPGTGLGEGYLLHQNGLFVAQGTEGGHADFAPVTDEQDELLRFMRQQFPAVSYEMLIAGPGIPFLYTFLRDQQNFPEQPSIRDQLQQADDQTAVIFSGALAKDPCPLCLKVVQLFLAILGSETGNLALKTYARGGVYIGGGIVPRLWGKISFEPFIKAFSAKAKMNELLCSIPIHLIVSSDASLLGAAHLGHRLCPC